MSKFSRLAGAGYGAALALLLLAMVPAAFGVVVSEGSFVAIFGVVILIVSGILELAGNKMEVGHPNA